MQSTGLKIRNSLVQEKCLLLQVVQEAMYLTLITEFGSILIVSGGRNRHNHV